MAVPTLSTYSITVYGSDSGQGYGYVSSNGGKALSEKGICWNTTGTPTTSDSKVQIMGTAIGLFPASMTSLIAATKYYVRAYAINADGTAYGSEVNFTTLAIETPSLQNVSLEGWNDLTPIPQKPNLQNVSLESRGELTPIQQKPNLQNVFVEWRDPEEPIPETPKLRNVWFQWGMPDYERPQYYGNAILFGGGL